MTNSHMNSGQRRKTKFRSSAVWKKFRSRLKSERKVDEITRKPLLKGFQLHHLDLDENHYEDISDETHFSCLNRQTHDMIHWLLRYYIADPGIIDRLRDFCERHKEINS